jgi:hypothetical protein
MKDKSSLFLLLIAVMMIVVTAAIVFLMLQASGLSLDLGLKEIEFQGIEDDLSFDPANGADNGFIVNPYQNGNLDRNQAVIIGATVSYILKEVKAFTMFAVVLMVLTLISYVIIACIVLNRIARPIIKIEEIQKEVSDKEHGGDNDNEESGGYIEDGTSGNAILSRNIDEMLSEIDVVMEKSKVKWSFLF